MHVSLPKLLLIGLTSLLLVTACVGNVTPSPTLEPTTPATATETPLAGTATAEPTATEESVELTASPEPTTAPLTEAAAVYSAGTGERLELFALTEEGLEVPLDQLIFQGGAVSPAGTWIAFPASVPPASGVVVRDLTSPKIVVVGARQDFAVLGRAAFDASEARLAVLEVSQVAAEAPNWAILLTDTETGALTRLVGEDWTVEGAWQPGFPIGWTGSGQELVLDTFIPYTDAGNQGVIALEVPTEITETVEITITDSSMREVLSEGEYRTTPRLSPEGTQLLYLARDEDYTPENYAPLAFDLAVNQLWTLDLVAPDAEPVQRLAVEDGSALARLAAWSPDGDQILYAQGMYAGSDFSSLSLHIHDGTEEVQDVGELMLPEGESLTNLYWCRPDLVLMASVSSEGTTQTLTRVALDDGTQTPVTSREVVEVLGCVDRASSLAP